MNVLGVSPADYGYQDDTISRHHKLAESEGQTASLKIMDIIGEQTASLKIMDLIGSTGF